MKTGAVDGIVIADMEIIRVLGKLVLLPLRNVGEGFILAGSNSLALAEFLRFLVRFDRPLAGEQEIRPARAVHQV